MFQILIKPSALPDTKYLLSGEKANDVIEPLCSLNTIIHFPLLISQILIVPYSTPKCIEFASPYPPFPVAIYLPSGETATEKKYSYFELLNFLIVKLLSISLIA